MFVESPGILFWHFPGPESPGNRLEVLENMSPGKAFEINVSEKGYEPCS